MEFGSFKRNNDVFQITETGILCNGEQRTKQVVSETVFSDPASRIVYVFTGRGYHCFMRGDVDISAHPQGGIYKRTDGVQIAFTVLNGKKTAVTVTSLKGKSKTTDLQQLTDSVYIAKEEKMHTYYIAVKDDFKIISRNVGDGVWEASSYHTTLHGVFYSVEKVSFTITDTTITYGGKEYIRDDITTTVFQENAAHPTDPYWIYIWTGVCYHCIIHAGFVLYARREVGTARYMLDSGMVIVFDIENSKFVMEEEEMKLECISNTVYRAKDSTNTWWYCIVQHDAKLLVVNHKESAQTFRILNVPEVGCGAADVCCPWKGGKHLLEEHQCKCAFFALRGVLKMLIDASNNPAQNKETVQRIAALEVKIDQQQTLILNQTQHINTLEVQLTEARKRNDDQDKLQLDFSKRVTLLETQLADARKRLEEQEKLFNDFKLNLDARIDARIAVVQKQLNVYINEQIAKVQADIRTYIDTTVTRDIKTQLVAYVDSKVTNIQTTIMASLTSYVDNRVFKEFHAQVVAEFDLAISNLRNQVNIDISTKITQAFKTELNTYIENSGAFKDVFKQLTAYIDTKASAIEVQLSKNIQVFIENSKVFQDIKSQLTTYLDQRITTIQSQMTTLIDTKVSQELKAQLTSYIDAQISQVIKMQIIPYIDTKAMPELNTKLLGYIDSKLSTIQSQCNVYIDGRIAKIQTTLVDYIDKSPKFMEIQNKLLVDIDQKIANLQAQLTTHLENKVFQDFKTQITSYINTTVVQDIKNQLIIVIDAKINGAKTEIIAIIEPTVIKQINAHITAASFFQDVKTQLLAYIKDSQALKDIHTQLITYIDNKVNTTVTTVVDARVFPEIKTQVISYIDGKVFQEMKNQLVAYIDGKVVNDIQNKLFSYIDVKVLQNMQKYIDNSPVFQEINAQLTKYVDARISTTQTQLSTYIDSRVSSIQADINTYIDNKIKVVDTHIDTKINNIFAHIENTQAFIDLRSQLTALIDTKIGNVQTTLTTYIDAKVFNEIKQQLITYIDTKVVHDVRGEIINYIDTKVVNDMRIELQAFIETKVSKDVINFFTNSQLFQDMKKKIIAYIEQSQVYKDLEAYLITNLDARVTKVQETITAYVDGKVYKDLKAQLTAYIDGKVFQDMKNQLTVYIDTKVFENISNYINKLTVYQDIKNELLKVIDGRLVGVHADLSKYVDIKVVQSMHTTIINFTANWKAFRDIQTQLAINESKIRRLEVHARLVSRQTDLVAQALRDIAGKLTIDDKVVPGVYNLIPDISFETNEKGVQYPFESAEFNLAPDGTLTGTLLFRADVKSGLAKQASKIIGKWDSSKVAFTYKGVAGGVGRTYEFSGTFFNGPIIDGTYNRLDVPETGRFHFEITRKVDSALCATITQGEWYQLYESLATTINTSAQLSGSITVTSSTVSVEEEVAAVSKP